MTNGRTQFRGLGGSPYQYNIIRPQGSQHEVGSQYTDLDQNVIGETIGSFIDAFQQRKDARKQARLERQEQALKIAEMQGEVTPELEEAILGPLQPEEPTLGGRALGGIARTFGIDTDVGRARPPFELTGEGGLKTEHERELEKEGREAQTETLKFYRGLIGKKFDKEMNVQEKQELFNRGLFQPGLSYAQRVELIHEKARKRAEFPIGNVKPQDKLRNDLYTGKKQVQDLTKADYLILGKFWASMTPESRAEEALSYAENLVAAQLKGSVSQPDELQLEQMIDRLAESYINKQDQLIDKMRTAEGAGRGGRRGRGTTGGTRSLNEIMTR